jgi:uncharacterized protein
LALLVLAAFAAGFIDAIAGGGGLLTVPALLSVGLPPHVVFGTNKGQAVFGATASLVAFWRRGLIDRTRARYAAACGFVGSLCGAWLLLRIPNEPLKPIIAVLLSIAVLLTFVQPSQVAAKVSAQSAASTASPESVGAAPSSIVFTSGLLALALGAYDGFFGPGTGTFLILGFTLLAGDSLTHASANAKVVNWASNLAAMLLFFARGTIVWKIALPMAAANIVGASLGARAAAHVGDTLVRWCLRIVATALIAKLAYGILRG